MIDLKLSEKQKKSQERPTSIEPADYPWGTRLRFETDQIKKLGLEGMRGGEMVSINAVAKILEIRIRDTGKDDKIESMEIQVQKAEILPMDDAKKKMRKAVAKEVWND